MLLPIQDLAGGRGSTVMGTVVSAFSRFLENQGAEVEDILERSAIHPDILTDPNQPISLAAFLKAVDTAALRTGNDNFGLWFGHQYRPEYLGLLGYVGLSSENLGSALLNMSRYFPEFQSLSTLKLSHYQRKVKLEYEMLDSAIVSRRHDAEMTIGNFFNVMRRALGERWSPLEVHFHHARPEGWQEHQKAFRADVRFEQEHNAIIVNASDLTQPMPGADPQLLLIAKQSFNVLKLAGTMRVTLADRVRAEIIETIHTGIPRIEHIAEHLGIPVWTLTRQLKEQGHTFSSLFETVRKELACHYLEQSNVSISRLAELLQYTETSSFSHAFMRWFGESPKRWRELHRM